MFPNTGFTSSEAFAHSVELFKAEIFGEVGLDVPSDNVLDLFDSLLKGPDQIEKIEKFVQQRELILRSRGGLRKLIIYYVGHGGFSTGEYFLAVRKSNKESYARTSIRFKDLAESIKKCAHWLYSFFIIDACFAAKGTTYFMAEPIDLINKQADTDLSGIGVCLLCSSASDKVSYILPDESCTGFTKALVAAAMNGHRDGSQDLTLDDLCILSWEQLQQFSEEYRQNQVEFIATQPEIHTPRRNGQDPAKIPLYPNRSPETRSAQQREISILPKPNQVEQNNEQRILLRQFSAINSSYQATFLHSILTAEQFSDIGFVFNPYSEFFDSTEPQDLARVKVYLWMPEPAYFDNPNVTDTTIVAICDAGVLEIDKHLRLLQPAFLKDCYQFTPSRLLPAKRAELIRIIGSVLRGTFVLAAVIPKFLLGAELRKADISYRSILSIVLLPLVVAHHRFGFQQFNLAISDEGNCQDSVNTFSKNILKSAFKTGNYNISTLNNQSNEYFYLYAARIISWSVSRFYNHHDGNWLTQLTTAFTASQ